MTTIRSNNASGITLKGSSSTYDFSLSWETVDRVIEPATNTDIQIDERIVNRQTGGQVMHDQRPIITPTDADPMMSFNLSSSDVAISVAEDGIFTHVADGDAHLKVASPYAAKGQKYRFLTTAQALARDIPTGFVATSLGKHCSDAIDLLIAGKTYSDTTAKVYTVQDHANSIYTRNPNCWSASLDISCASPWNSYQAVYRAGTLVSPQDGYCAKHYPLGVGTRVRFVSMTGVVYERTVSSVNSSMYGDLQYFHLDSPLPSSIKPAKIIPHATYRDKVSDWGAYAWYGIPALCLDAQEKAAVKTVSSLLDLTYMLFNSEQTKISAQRGAFYEELIVGDSGNPAFIFINGDAVAIAEWKSPEGGVNPGAWDAEHGDYYLNIAMAAAGSAYRLTEADISAFPDYDTL